MLNNKQKTTLIIVMSVAFAIVIGVLVTLLILQKQRNDMIQMSQSKPVTMVVSEPQSTYTLDKVRLSDEDVRYKSNWELCLMRNEIFARHGYIFSRSELRAHFENQPWYRGTTTRLGDIHLNDIEKYNVNLIKKYE